MVVSGSADAFLKLTEFVDTEVSSEMKGETRDGARQLELGAVIGLDLLDNG
jgi:hypothetical protein